MWGLRTESLSNLHWYTRVGIVGRLTTTWDSISWLTMIASYTSGILQTYFTNPRDSLSLVDTKCVENKRSESCAVCLFVYYLAHCITFAPASSSLPPPQPL